MPTKNTPFKDYVKFDVLGVSDLISEEDKQRIKELETEKDFILNNPYTKKTIDHRPLYMIDLYSPEQQVRIFNLQDRKGLSIVFLNTENYKCKIVKAFLRGQTPILKWSFIYNTNKEFYLPLDRFLEIYSWGEFHDIYPKEFTKVYLTKVDDKLKALQDELDDFYQMLSALYEKEKDELKAGSLEAELAFDKLEKEAPSKRYSIKRKELSPDEALQAAYNTKDVQALKNKWKFILTEEEKKTFLEWIAKNIYSIRVYGVIDGRSGNLLKQEYGDYGNIKYREPKTDEEGRNTSSDNISAYISLETTEEAPEEILRKFVGRDESQELFRNNRLNSKNLALFLLSEYHDAGFKAGIRHLNKEIDLSKLN